MRHASTPLTISVYAERRTRLSPGTKVRFVDLAALPGVPTTQKKDPILISKVQHDRSCLPNLGEGLGMSTLMSIAIAKHYSCANGLQGTKGTKSEKRWQFVGNKWFSLIRKHILRRKLLWMNGRWNFLALAFEPGRGSQLVRQCGTKFRKAALRNPFLPGFPTTSTPRFGLSFLRVCIPTSQESVVRQPPHYGRSLSLRLLLIQAFEDVLLVRSLPPLAREEIPPHSPSTRV